jgi:hypothetical protein
MSALISSGTSLFIRLTAVAWHMACAWLVELTLTRRFVAVGAVSYTGARTVKDMHHYVRCRTNKSMNETYIAPMCGRLARRSARANCTCIQMETAS